MIEIGAVGGAARVRGRTEVLLPPILERGGRIADEFDVKSFHVEIVAQDTQGRSFGAGGGGGKRDAECGLASGGDGIEHIRGVHGEVSGVAPDHIHAGDVERGGAGVLDGEGLRFTGGAGKLIDECHGGIHQRHRLAGPRCDRFQSGQIHGRKELSVAAVSPSDGGLVAPERHRVVGASGNRGRPIQPPGYGRLAGTVISPSNESAVASESHRMMTARGDRPHIAPRLQGHIRLSIEVSSPSDHGAVGLQRHGVGATSRDRPDACQSGGGRLPGRWHYFPMPRRRQSPTVCPAAARWRSPVPRRQGQRRPTKPRQPLAAWKRGWRDEESLTIF